MPASVRVGSTRMTSGVRVISVLHELLDTRTVMRVESTIGTITNTCFIVKARAFRFWDLQYLLLSILACTANIDGPLEDLVEKIGQSIEL